VAENLFKSDVEPSGGFKYEKSSPSRSGRTGTPPSDEGAMKSDREMRAFQQGFWVGVMFTLFLVSLFVLFFKVQVFNP
jgi:hypothetical protein